MQGSGSFRLVVRRGPQPNQVYPLTEDVGTIGRDITNGIVINDPEVSRHHCRLTRGGGGYTIEDIGSTNGTFINGQRVVGARPLSSGDSIGLGETVTLSYEVAMIGGEFAPAQPSRAPVGPVGGVGAPAEPQPIVQPYSPPAPQPTFQPPQAGYSTGQGYQPNQPQVPASVGQTTTAGYTPPPPPAYPSGGQYPYNYEQPPAPGMGRWFFIGCGCLIVLCIFVTVGAALYIDSNDLYCRVPLLRDVITVIRNCP
jgi:pSer/pThr/pTyr-binding forkhead associated (FHA) protein